MGNGSCQGLEEAGNGISMGTEFGFCEVKEFWRQMVMMSQKWLRG
jgi:hypothetical protein